MISDRDLHTLQLLVNILRQYAGKVLGRTQSSAVDIRFEFTKSVLTFRVDQSKILILGVEGVLKMHRKLMEDLELKSNLMMESLMQSTILSILVTVFVQVGKSELATIKRCCFAWGKVRELLPLLTCKTISLNTNGQMG